ncbi:MAG: YeeE/YedE family protein, partial [Roseinatronobacter sp.]
GHGVCGISRFSLRGIVATVLYLLAGGIAMVLFRHVLGVI